MSRITNIDVSTEKVHNQLSIMEIVSSQGMREVIIAFYSPVPPYMLSVPNLADITTDLLPDIRNILTKQLDSSGNELKSICKLRITFWSGTRLQIPKGQFLMFEASLDDKIIEYEETNKPTQIPVIRSSIDSCSKSGGSKNILGPI